MDALAIKTSNHLALLLKSLQDKIMVQLKAAGIVTRTNYNLIQIIEMPSLIPLCVMESSAALGKGTTRAIVSSSKSSYAIIVGTAFLYSPECIGYQLAISGSVGEQADAALHSANYDPDDTIRYGFIPVVQVATRELGKRVFDTFNAHLEEGLNSPIFEKDLILCKVKRLGSLFIPYENLSLQLVPFYSLSVWFPTNELQSSTAMLDHLGSKCVNFCCNDSDGKPLEFVDKVKNLCETMEVIPQLSSTQLFSTPKYVPSYETVVFSRHDKDLIIINNIGGYLVSTDDYIQFFMAEIKESLTEAARMSSYLKEQGGKDDVTTSITPIKTVLKSKEIQFERVKLDALPQTPDDANSAKNKILSATRAFFKPSSTATLPKDVEEVENQKEPAKDKPYFTNEAVMEKATEGVSRLSFSQGSKPLSSTMKGSTSFFDSLNTAASPNLRDRTSMGASFQSATDKAVSFAVIPEDSIVAGNSTGSLTSQVEAGELASRLDDLEVNITDLRDKISQAEKDKPSAPAEDQS